MNLCDITWLLTCVDRFMCRAFILAVQGTSPGGNCANAVLSDEYLLIGHEIQGLSQ